MDLLPLAVRRPVVAVAVGMHEIVVAQHARQRAVHGRIVEDLPYGGNPGHQVVAGVAILLEKGFGLVPNVLMELTGMPGLDRDVPIADEVAHLLVGKTYHG